MNTQMTVRSHSPLTNEQLLRAAPSVFATRPWEGMTPRYTFIPTIQIVDRMRSEGFQPVAAGQSLSRIEGKQNFTRHMIRFRDMRKGDSPATHALGTVYPELVLTNSHDGASAYKLDAGLFRLICTNGMVVSAGEISSINVRHSGSADGIIDATYQVVEEFPKVLGMVERFGDTRLSPPQQEAFAEAALMLRYELPPVTPLQMLRARRSGDAAPTLWNTLNVVQEHLINGGVRGVNQTTQRRIRTRAIGSITENVRLNKALWTLAERMQALATA